MGMDAAGDGIRVWTLPRAVGIGLSMIGLLLNFWMSFRRGFSRFCWACGREIC